MRILKRIKNKLEYFYLQHSFRENNRIITKEKYLGRIIPKNIEEIKREFFKQFENNINKKLGAVKNNFQAEWRRIPDSIKDKQLNEISIAFTYNTNAIEGSKITLEETRGIIKDKISPNRPIRDVRETENHAKVFLEMLKPNEKLSEELILKWHKQIFLDSKPEIAGKYREHLVTVGSYLAPDWQDVKDLMFNLFKFIKKDKLKFNPVEFSARVHYRFEKIHPFSDGNGRIGRLIIGFILWHSGYPMLIIEKRKKKAYYKALSKDEDNFVKYFMRTYLKANKNRF
jgi:Fic family protein